MKTNSVVAIIPARFDSQRLPGKPLLEICGRPMIIHVLDRVRRVPVIDRVIVATDHEGVRQVVWEHGGEAQLTSPDHASGTDRIAEVAENVEADVIVNVQGDEPLVEPQTIEAALAPVLGDASIGMATPSEPICEMAELFDPNVVKVVTDCRGFALYFSRLPIPHIRGDDPLEVVLKTHPEWLSAYRKHTGLYVYRRDCLLEFAGWEPTPLERFEKLEQLRALEHGIPIRVVPVQDRSLGVDTPADLERVRRVMKEEMHHG